MFSEAYPVHLIHQGEWEEGATLSRSPCLGGGGRGRGYTLSRSCMGGVGTSASCPGPVWGGGGGGCKGGRGWSSLPREDVLFQEEVGRVEGKS